MRGTVDGLVARSFGPPATTAECAAPLLAVGGLLVVSDPPDAGDRWPVEGLALLGLVPVRRAETGPALQVLRQDVPCPDRYPRRIGIPAKRPLF
jgi:16S rRNA (guanine527-N7)-methyltransferase